MKSPETKVIAPPPLPRIQLSKDRTQEFATAQRLEGELSRARIVCLGPGLRAYRHVDRDGYKRLRNRHPLVPKPSGCWMRSGELWWFDNDRRNEARNDGDDDRIYLIFDLLPRGRTAAVTAGEGGRALPMPGARGR